MGSNGTASTRCRPNVRAQTTAHQRLDTRGLRSSLQTIRSKSGFDPAETTSTFRVLNSRLSLLTRARNRRITTPSSVSSLFSAPVAPVDTVRRAR